MKILETKKRNWRNNTLPAISDESLLPPEKFSDSIIELRERCCVFWGREERKRASRCCKLWTIAYERKQLSMLLPAPIFHHTSFSHFTNPLFGFGKFQFIAYAVISPKHFRKFHSHFLHSFRVEWDQTKWSLSIGEQKPWGRGKGRTLFGQMQNFWGNQLKGERWDKEFRWKIWGYQLIGL